MPCLTYHRTGLFRAMLVFCDVESQIQNLIHKHSAIAFLRATRDKRKPKHLFLLFAFYTHA